jgi:hypothetical protein
MTGMVDIFALGNLANAICKQLPPMEQNVEEHFLKCLAYLLQA